LEAGGINLPVIPSGEFGSAQDIGGVIIAKSGSGTPVYLRDLMDITRGYATPPQFLNFYTTRDQSGQWQQRRAVTLAVQMKSGEQITAFGHSIDQALELLRMQLPDDLIIARTSDQPAQVAENVELFNHALEEAIGLVVLVSLIGFWQWR
jgi:multidrug efflux pump subunit AcrB